MKIANPTFTKSTRWGKNRVVEAPHRRRGILMGERKNNEGLTL